MLPDVVVDLAHQLVVVLDERSCRKRQPPVRPVGQRNVLQEVLCDRADPVSRNLVIDERLPADRVDQLRRSRRKVASTLRFGWNELNKSFRRAVDARPLVGSEVEELALDNRAAHAATRLIPLQRVFLGCEELARVQSAPSRMKWNAVPWTSLVPDLTTTLTMPPPALPYSAVKLLD